MTELPTTFGKYFLTEKLATGGMAEIYLGKLMGPGGFEKQLVIKQIHPKLSGQRHFVDLFVAEAKTLVTLAHGNIVPVYELGVIDDTYFIAMEYIDGPTLYRFTEALARRDARMEPAVAAWLAARILEGLDYAHRKGEGVIHRDLSPRNVMLSRDGEVKLVDFGIAVPLGAADDSDGQSAPTGSFPYMSPEQVRREPLTGQTDLFSVGVLMWEMLTGHRLFARPDPDATLHAVTDDDIPRPSELDPAIPARLDEVVMRALERDQTERWRSAGEMLQALQRYLYSLDRTPGPRDVAALVAKHCPPETRRLPTHSDAPGSDPAAAAVPAGPYTAKIDRSGGGDGEVGGGDVGGGDVGVSGIAATAVAEPRDAAEAPEPPEVPAPAPRGKRRARTETFATHVQLKQMLERATPLVPIPAITDDVELPQTHVAPKPAEPAPPSRPNLPNLPNLPVPGRTPPSRALLVLLALGTLALGAAAIFVFARGRARNLEPDAAISAGNDAAAPAPADAAPASTDAAPAATDADPDPDPAPDAAIPLDAPRALASPPDAGPRTPPHDAAHSATAPLDAPRPAGDATLVVGANPWGDILVDGARRGRTPTTLVIPAGPHVVEVVFGGEDPPRTQRFSVDLRAGETKQLDADFTKP